MAGIKNNRRTQYTLEHIKNSFLELLQTKEISQITITEICKRADINRGTFYLHYRDVYHLLECLQEEIYKQTMEILTTKEGLCESGGGLTSLLQAFQEQKSLYHLLLLGESGRHLFTRIILEMYTGAISIQPTDSSIASNKLTEQSKLEMKDMDYHYTYMVYGAMGVINQWLESGAEQPVEEIAQIISSFSHSTSHAR